MLVVIVRFNEEIYDLVGLFLYYRASNHSSLAASPMKRLLKVLLLVCAIVGASLILPSFHQPFVFAQVNTFCASNLPCTVSAAWTFTGPINCTKIGTVPCIDQTNTQGWAGADGCAWINSAQSAANGLNNLNGSIDVYLTNQTCAGTFSVGSTSQAVRMNWKAAGTILVQNTVNIAQGSQLFGIAGQSGNLGTNASIIQAGASFPSSTTLVQMGPNSGTADSVSLRDVTVSCADKTGSTGITVSNVQDIGDITGVFVFHCLTNGFNFTNSTQNFTIKDSFSTASASATADNGYNIAIQPDHLTFINAGCTSSAAAPSSGACFAVSGSNITIMNSHMENHTDGILLSSGGVNQGAVVINGIDGLVNLANTLHIASTWQGALSAHGIRKFNGTNSVKNDQAAFNHVCTDEALGHYILGSNATVIQLDTDCSTLSTFKKAPFVISGTTAGNFAQDATAMLDMRGPSAAFNMMRQDDTTNSTSWYVGPGVGANVYGFRDRVNNKNMLFLNQSASGGTATLPTACTTTVAQSTLNPAVVLPICAMTSQKTESAADANVLTFTPPAVAGRYRISLNGSLSAANTATLGWTATWTDSNGTAQAPTNLPVCISSAGTCGATTGALSTTVTFSGDYYVDVNNAATAIVIKLTFSGTSFTAKVTATVERII